MKKLITLMTLGLTIVASSNLFAAVGEADDSAPVACEGISDASETAAPAASGSTVVVQPSGVNN